MNVQEFVKDSLVQVCQGVDEAAQELSENGAYVNPPHGLSPAKLRFVQHDNPMIVNDLEFDIAVITGKAEGSEGGIGLLVMGLGLGATGTQKDEESQTSRIRFKVPVALPQTAIPESLRSMRRRATGK